MVTLVVTLVTVGVQQLIDQHMSPIIEKQIQVQERHLNTFLEDSVLIQQIKMLQNLKQTKDAGPVLQSYLKWDLSIRSERNLSQSIIPKKTSEQLIYYGPKWLEKYRLFRTSDADLGILDTLKDYDYWNIEENSPIQKIISTGKFLHPAELPLPNNIELIHLAKLSLLRGLNDNDLEPQLRKVRHFARILLNSQNIILITAGLSILHAEREAYLFHIENLNRPDFEDWDIIEQSELKRIHRYIWALRGYFRVWSKTEQMQQIVERAKDNFGFCAALNDAIPFAMSFKPYLQYKIPYEMDYSKNYSFFEELGESYSGTCRFAYVNHSIEHPPRSIKKGRSLFHLLPFFRRLVGLQLNLVPRPDFDGYEALRP